MGDDAQQWLVLLERGRSIDLNPIRTLLARIEQRFHPEQIWLFGSRARGEAGPTSDWDLLIVVPNEVDEDDLGPVTEMRRGYGVRADVILCRADEFEEAREVANTLAYEVAHTGVRIDAH